MDANIVSKKFENVFSDLAYTIDVLPLYNHHSNTQCERIHDQCTVSTMSFK